MDKTIRWLLDGDVSVQAMTHRLILHSDPAVIERLRGRIPTEGDGARYLSSRSENGHWGLHYYQPKWTSTHYTLLEMKNIGMPESTPACREMVARTFAECMTEGGGVNLAKSDLPSDVAVDGMVLNYVAYFRPDDSRVADLARHLVAAGKNDGGFTWDERSDHGDPHTTICVLEGLGQFERSVPDHGLSGLAEAKAKAIEFLLSNGLFVGADDRRFRQLSYPFRYRYDLLRVLSYFADEGVSYDDRMRPALDWLLAKRNQEGVWFLEHVHEGRVHFPVGEVGQPSRHLTVLALHVLGFYGMANDRTETSACAPEETRRSLQAMLDRSTVAVAQFAPGTSQHTLQSRRIAALTLALGLLSDEAAEASATDRTMATTALSSLLSKSEKALAKLKPESWQQALLDRNIKALRIAIGRILESPDTTDPEGERTHPAPSPSGRRTKEGVEP
ncbi:MAG: hypothetical protein WC509_01475 [Candidatus Izemoplasmatales bacterium]